MPGQGEFERNLRQLIGPTLTLGLAQVVGPIPNPFNPALSDLVSVLLQPGNIPAEMRLLQFGHGPGPQGLFFQVIPGAEVLVLYPNEDPNAGVALAGLSSGANIKPLPTDGAGAILMAILGVTIRSASGLPASAFVKGDLYTGGPPGAAPPFGGLATWVTAVETFMFATSTATTAVQIATAAAAFMATVGKVLAAPSPFSVSLTTSANPATAGGPPFASLTNKVTD